MELVPLSEIFHIEYGNQYDFSKMTKDPDGISFISRSKRNFGIVGKVKPIKSIDPYPAGFITVTLGGTYLLSSFVQPYPFYTAQNIKVLNPKTELSFNEKLFYCLCIEKNRFKYSSHGREANVTLNQLLVPSQAPQWSTEISALANVITQPKQIDDLVLNTYNWKEFKLSSLFIIERGKGARVSDVKSEGLYPFVTSKDRNNGWSGYVDNPPMHKGNVISVARNGSVGEAFYQPLDFCSTEDVHIFNPRFEMNQYIALFLVSLIRKEKFRYNHGRKWGLDRMRQTIIKLPVNDKGEPDFAFMEKFIKSLPYSSSI